MDEIALELLGGVTGAGTSTSEVSVGPVSARSSQTDYQTCTAAVTQATAQQYPSTAQWWNPFSTDTNAGPRASATMQNLKETCGLPPRG